MVCLNHGLLIVVLLVSVVALGGYITPQEQEQFDEVEPGLDAIQTDTVFQGGTYLATDAIIDEDALSPAGATIDGKMAYVRKGAADDQIYIEDENGLFEMWIKEGTDMPLTDCLNMTYSVNGTCRVNEDESVGFAMNEIEDYPTFDYDGQPYSLALVGSEKVQCEYCWGLTFEFTTTHAGYGDRSDEDLPREITRHTAVVEIREGVVTSMVYDGVWDELEQEMVG